jgi:hypothetical protein
MSRTIKFVLALAILVAILGFVIAAAAPMFVATRAALCATASNCVNNIDFEGPKTDTTQPLPLSITILGVQFKYGTGRTNGGVEVIFGTNVGAPNNGVLTAAGDAIGVIPMLNNIEITLPTGTTAAGFDIKNSNTSAGSQTGGSYNIFVNGTFVANVTNTTYTSFGFFGVNGLDPGLTNVIAIRAVPVGPLSPGEPVIDNFTFGPVTPSPTPTPTPTPTPCHGSGCPTPTPTPTPNPTPYPCSGTVVEDNDPHIAYSNGWHLVNNSSASAGHFRLNEGGDNQHNAILTFYDPAPSGSVTYYYATSPKGGNAEVFLDNTDMGSVSYYGTTGSNRSPVFGAMNSYSYGFTTDGQHKLEIRPIHNANDGRNGVYIDWFCLGNATATGNPPAHPGITSESLVTQSAGQALLSNITLPAGTQAISIAAESSVAVPIQLVLINPSGRVVQTVNSSSGVAILEAPITQSGVYVIKTVNLSLGPVQIWTVATPLVSTSLVSQMSNGPTTERRKGTPQDGPRSPFSDTLVAVCKRVLISYG